MALRCSGQRGGIASVIRYCDARQVCKCNHNTRDSGRDSLATGPWRRMGHVGRRGRVIMQWIAVTVRSRDGLIATAAKGSGSTIGGAAEVFRIHGRLAVNSEVIFCREIVTAVIGRKDGGIDDFRARRGGALLKKASQAGDYWTNGSASMTTWCRLARWFGPAA
jgi:hypothetical protein